MQKLKIEEIEEIVENLNDEALSAYKRIIDEEINYRAEIEDAYADERVREVKNIIERRAYARAYAQLSRANRALTEAQELDASIKLANAQRDVAAAEARFAKLERDGVPFDLSEDNT